MDKDTEELIDRVNAFIEMMAPHQKTRIGGQLFIQARDEIVRLAEEVERLENHGYEQ